MAVAQEYPTPAPVFFVMWREWWLSSARAPLPGQVLLRHASRLAGGLAVAVGPPAAGRPRWLRYLFRRLFRRLESHWCWNSVRWRAAMPRRPLRRLLFQF